MTRQVRKDKMDASHSPLSGEDASLQGTGNYSGATPQNMLRPSRVIAGVAGGIAGFSGAALGAAAAVPVAAVGVMTGQPEQNKTVQKAAAAMGNATGTVTVAAVKFALSPVAIFEKARAANLFKQQVKIDNGQAPGYEFLDIAGGFIAKGKQQRGVSDDQPYQFGDLWIGAWHM